MAIASANRHQNIDFQLGVRVKDYAASHLMVFVGRGLFSLIFLLSSFNHFSQAMIDYAAQQNVPWPQFLVPLSGVIALVGSLSILLGFQARIGALLIVLFLIPVTLMMHNFWAMSDPAQVELQRVMFMKNISMLGGAILIFYFGAGPMSFDKRSQVDHR